MNNRNEIECHDVRWGDIYTCNLGENKGSVQGGVRPVLVIQDSIMTRNSPTVTVVSITSVLKKAYLKSHVILGEECGLRKKSMAMLEQVQTVNKNTDLIRYIGHIGKKDIQAVKDALIYTMNTDKEEGIILTLCPRCRRDIMNDPDHIIRRVHNGSDVKETCDMCQHHKGFNYMVERKRKSNLSSMR